MAKSKGGIRPKAAGNINGKVPHTKGTPSTRPTQPKGHPSGKTIKGAPGTIR